MQLVGEIVGLFFLGAAVVLALIVLYPIVDPAARYFYSPRGRWDSKNE